VSFRQSLFAFVFAMVAVRGNVSAEPKPMGLKSEDHLALDFLMSAVSVNQDLYATMESFVCNERIERYKSPSFAKNGHVDTVTTTVSFETEQLIESGYAAIYNFDVAAEESPWDLAVGDWHYGIPFHTRVWIKEPSGEIVRIERSSTRIPYGISTVSWDVSLVPVMLGDKQWLLPDSAEYRVNYRHFGQNDRNTIKFSDYRRYGSESSIRFN